MSIAYRTTRAFQLIALTLVSTGAPPALADRTIYRCEVAGVTTFSDRPCGARSTVYDPVAAPVAISDPVPLQRPKSQTPKATRRRPETRPPAAPSTGDQAGRAGKCARIQSSLNDIRARMRAGYSASEGERLRRRRARLNERRKAERCH